MHLTRICAPVAGAHVMQSDWAALLFQVLVAAFEVQSNALDSCAVACICTRWQAAASSCFVSNLHLHINRSVLCRGRWSDYLSRQNKIGHLKLTAGNAAEHTLQSGRHCPLSSLSCELLFLINFSNC